MPDTASSILQNATLFTDGQRYHLIQLPANAILLASAIIAKNATPFTSMIADKDEVTLILHEEAYHQLSGHLREHRVAEISYRLITFDVELDLSLVGFMAEVSRILTDVGVSILPYAAYTRDHILVKEEDFETAINALKAFQDK